MEKLIRHLAIAAFVFAALPLSAQADDRIFDSWVPLNSPPAAGHDVAYGAGMFVAVGNDALAQSEILVSNDAVEWTELPPLRAPYLHSIAYGRGRFVALGGPLDAAETRHAVLVSTNGLDWTVESVGLALLAIEYGNGWFVAIDSRQVYTSVNGVDWELRVPTAEWNLKTIAFGSGRFVVGGTRGVASSTDGIHWTPFDRSWPYGNDKIIAGDDGEFIAVSGSEARVSRDALTWTPLELPRVGSILGGGSGRGLFILSGGSATMGSFVVSADTMQWTSIAAPFPDVRSIIYADGKFVALSRAGFGIATSTNGAVWTVQQRDQRLTLNGIAQGNGEFVIGGTSSTGPVSFHSLDGTNWTRRHFGVEGALASLAFADGLYVAVTFHGEYQTAGSRIFTSPDGLDWTLRFSETNAPLQALARGGGRWVAAGFDGRVAVSTNGLDWTASSIPTTDDFSSIAYGNGMFVIAGGWISASERPPWRGGQSPYLLTAALYSSPDGINWTRRDSGTGFALRGVASGAGRFVAVRWYGSYLVSQDGIQWKERDFGGSPAIGSTVTYTPLDEAGYEGGWFVAKSRVASFVSDDLQRWQPVNLPPGDMILHENHLIAADSVSGIIWRSELLRRPAQVSIRASRFSAEDRGMEGVFTIQRGGSHAADLEVALDASGSAAAGVDYQALPSSVVIPANTSYITLPLRVLPDSAAEADECVTVSLRALGEMYSIDENSSATLLIKETTDVPVFQPDQIAVEQSGAVRFSAHLPPTGSYVVEVSQDLKTWAELQPIAPGNNPVTIRDDAAGQGGQRYYRIRAVTP